MKKNIRIGMIVPSSNITMEKEIPQAINSNHFESKPLITYHSARVGLKNVSREELKQMNLSAVGAAESLADASVDIILYACLVAVMVEGKGAHNISEKALREGASSEEKEIPVVTSAGALVQTLRDINVQKVAVIAPYLPSLTETVCGYIKDEGVQVIHSHSLAVTNNLQVGELDQNQLIAIASGMPEEAEAVVLSACVQMPSLDVLAKTEELLGKPVISAATATVYQAMKTLGMPLNMNTYGKLLSGKLEI